MTDASRRDESTDALLHRVLSHGQEPETTELCLDAETAAAWLDGKLHGDALERARTHVADCARCQAMMATFVKAEGGVASPVAPVAPAGPTVVDIATRRSWWTWLVPVAAAAAVVVAVVMLRTPPPVATTTPARAPEPPKAADAKNAAVETPPVEEKKAEEQRADAKDVDRLAKLDAQKRQQDAKTRPAPPPANAAKPANEVAAAAPPPPPVTQPAPATTPLREEGRLHELVQAPPLKRDEIGSPDPMIRWRLRRRTVERSIDGGKSWTAVPTGVDAEWTAGAAPTPTALWIVGRGGMIARSTDGRAFERIPFPELTDLSAVQATDAQTATVSSADGHTFSTTDGGRSWARK
jgi:negative regulator of sigma E activity